ncbi:MAG: hypothetical protein QOG50_112 [Actinomycetota bacterium]|nr:hypothetical protein [Actinomycetota bacterium]
MDAGGICVARSLPIDAALVRDVLIRLRRDVPGGVARWTLGEWGAAELDVDFFPILTAGGDTSPAWSSTARLWDPDGIAMLPAVVEIRAAAVDTCELTLRPATSLAPWWTARTPALLDLATATLEELGEELLWHATREDLATHRDFP